MSIEIKPGKKIRVPAFLGLTGMKPTLGFVPHLGDAGANDKMAETAEAVEVVLNLVG